MDSGATGRQADAREADEQDGDAAMTTKRQKPQSSKLPNADSAEASTLINQIHASQPDEARMSEIAKRLLSTPPDRQSTGKALAPKKPSNAEG